MAGPLYLNCYVYSWPILLCIQIKSMIKKNTLISYTYLGFLHFSNINLAVLPMRGYKISIILERLFSTIKCINKIPIIVYAYVDTI